MRKYNNIISNIILLTALMALTPFGVQAGQNLVLFDEGHGQRFLAEGNDPLDLSSLSELVKNEGLQIAITKEEITEKVLAEVDALVISGAFASFTQPEITSIIDFINKGGRLCVMLHIGPPVHGLLSKLNVYVSKGVVHEQLHLIQQNDVDYYITPSSQLELMKGVERFKVMGGWALITDNEHSEIIAQTSAKSWLDTNMNNKQDSEEKQRPLGLAIAGKLGNGDFVVFGDDAIFQNRFLTEENIQLGKNLAKWLKGSESITPSNQIFL